MQQSNAYIIGFAVVLTIVLGGALSVAAVLLKEPQDKAVELDTKKQILSAVMSTEGYSKQELADIYSKRIRSVVVNIDGEEVEDYGVEKPEDINIKKQYKKKNPEDKFLPVFKYLKEGSDSEIEAFILPVYGFGLWDNIWGFTAIKNDFNTIKGVTFDHKAETPGLGARITSAEIQNRYEGKKLYDDGELVSVDMVKGEGNEGLTEHQVDGMSGATITGKGVNDMLKNYMGYYEGYFKKMKTSMSQAAL